MKSTAALILIIALLAQFTGRYIVMIDYAFNKNYISKVLCIERNRSKSQCNGKCYLKKQLAKATKEENAPNSNTRPEKNEVLYFTNTKKITFDLFILKNDNQYASHRQPFTPQIRYHTIFHPPKVV